MMAAGELASILRMMGHPDRLRIIETLSGTEMDVNTLLSNLNLPGPRVSQHLSLLRAHKIVNERRSGRHHFYRLSRPLLTNWMIDGLRVVSQYPFTNEDRTCQNLQPE